jgi:hypothetical protein
MRSLCFSLVSLNYKTLRQSARTFVLECYSQDYGWILRRNLAWPSGITVKSLMDQTTLLEVEPFCALPYIHVVTRWVHGIFIT